MLLACNTKSKDNCPNNIDLSANFTIQQDLNFKDLDQVDRYSELNNDTVYVIKFIKTDSSISYQNIRLRFRTSETKKKCEWTISGDPTIWTGYEKKIDFSGVTGTLEATCTKEFEPWKECFPELTGYDTVKRKFHFKVKENPSFYGKYFGHNEDNPNDTFSIIFGYYDYQGNVSNMSYSIGNFPKGYKFYQTELSLSYSEFYYSENSSGSAKLAHGYTKENGNKIIIDYIHNQENPDFSISYVTRRFIGTKVK